MQHGTPEDCAALRVQAIQEQRQAVQQVPEQPLSPEQRPPLFVAGPAQAPPEPSPVQQPAVPDFPAPEQRRVRGPRL